MKVMKSSVNKMVLFAMLIVILFGIYGSMTIFQMNEFLSILIIFPVSVFLIGIFSYKLFQSIWAGPSATFLVSIISMFTIFNTSFWIWVLIYIFICLLGTFIGKGVLFLFSQTIKHS
ncbi:DUF2651 family protein [Bacillus sp. FJAT-49732]|uniref:DUF2651 family protein n=1 Tax=Lederbergia citrisecunda TaxID=2833583 RepID=A0A942YKZ7_9BACI|nr:DUF2651 family protein [Lederbergia citrisecunda]MBS4199115.1 DUF2651 family protein [Lederbergia citrisecunda]